MATADKVRFANESQDYVEFQKYRLIAEQAAFAEEAGVGADADAEDVSQDEADVAQQDADAAEDAEEVSHDDEADGDAISLYNNLLAASQNNH